MTFNTEILSLVENLRKGYAKNLSGLAHEEGLTPCEGSVLSFLRFNPGYDAPSDITRLIQITKGNVSSSVHSLEEKGYLVSKTDEKDHCLSHLTLTEKSFPFLNRVSAMRAKWVKKLMAGFSSSETKELSSFLLRINENITK